MRCGNGKGNPAGHAPYGRGTHDLAIAHRLSTLRDAERLVVMEEGGIVEEGKQDEMMQRKGVFYGLVEIQQEASKIIAIAE